MGVPDQHGIPSRQRSTYSVKGLQLLSAVVVVVVGLFGIDSNGHDGWRAAQEQLTVLALLAVGLGWARWSGWRPSRRRAEVRQFAGLALAAALAAVGCSVTLDLGTHWSSFAAFVVFLVAATMLAAATVRTGTFAAIPVQAVVTWIAFALWMLAYDAGDAVISSRPLDAPWDTPLFVLQGGLVLFLAALQACALFADRAVRGRRGAAANPG